MFDPKVLTLVVGDVRHQDLDQNLLWKLPLEKVGGRPLRLSLR